MELNEPEDLEGLKNLEELDGLEVKWSEQCIAWFIPLRLVI